MKSWMFSIVAAVIAYFIGTAIERLANQRAQARTVPPFNIQQRIGDYLVMSISDGTYRVYSVNGLAHQSFACWICQTEVDAVALCEAFTAMRQGGECD